MSVTQKCDLLLNFLGIRLVINSGDKKINSKAHGFTLRRLVMAEVRNVLFKATKSTPGGNIWQLTVQYDCVLTEKELKYDFDYKDWFEVWEHDYYNSHDKVTKKGVGVSTFDPSTKLIRRTLTANVNGNDLDTQVGKEWLYAKVFLKNDTLNILYPAINSAYLHLDP